MTYKDVVNGMSAIERERYLKSVRMIDGISMRVDLLEDDICELLIEIRELSRMNDILFNRVEKSLQG